MALESQLHQRLEAKAWPTRKGRATLGQLVQAYWRLSSGTRCRHVQQPVEARTLHSMHGYTFIDRMGMLSLVLFRELDESPRSGGNGQVCQVGKTAHA